MTTSPDWRFVISNPAHFVAFGFGSGLARFAPGTFGSLAAIPLFMLLASLPQMAYLLLVAVMFLAGIRICGVTGRALGVHDHSGIVWDEIVAMLLILAFTPYTWAWIGLAFLLFRLFDIWKPFPILWFDRSVHGGLGVMLDDLLAAGYALAALKGLQWLLTR
jgi:phosphatidylglycerophosphatase A